MAARMRGFGLGAALVMALALGGCEEAAPESLLASSAGLPDMVLGDASAPVTIIEYASMTCTHCAAFHAGSLPRLKEDYIDTGRVRLIFREFPLDSRAVAASLLARCAAGDAGDTARFFGFIDVLFSRQRQWALTDNPYGALQSIARAGGIGAQTFDACMQDEESLIALREQAEHASKILEINSTPTLFIGSERLEGNRPYSEIREAVEKALQAAGAI